MNHPLHNPVYNALLTGDAHLAHGNAAVRYFHEDVSPFVGFHEDYENGFDDLFEQLPEGRTILYATPGIIKLPNGWKLLAEIEGLQFVYTNGNKKLQYAIEPMKLDESNVNDMITLATLTKPGPFGKRTIDFGHYYGIFEKEKLVAMTGQRMHVHEYSEISAVCTHPDHLGKGYAAALLAHQVNLIHSQGKQCFLHVRADNERAIALYKGLGFEVSRGMNFYFMRRWGVSIK